MSDRTIKQPEEYPVIKDGSLNFGIMPESMKRHFPVEESLKVWGAPWNRVKEIAKTRWLIEGVLGCGQIGLIYGAPGAYKSFIALDMALSVAAGIDWQGRATDKGGVLYIAAEGGDDVIIRQSAWMTYNQIESASIHIMDNAPLISEDRSGLKFCIEAYNKKIGLKADTIGSYQKLKEQLRGQHYTEIMEREGWSWAEVPTGDEFCSYMDSKQKAQLKVLDKFLERFDERGVYKPSNTDAELRLIVIDTYAQTSEGDSREVWNKYYRNLKASLPKGCSALIIDHATKGGDTFMGTLGKMGDVDFMASVKRGKGESATLRVKNGAGKVKAAPEFDDLHFKMKLQEITYYGSQVLDGYGKPLSSLVATAIDAPDAGLQDAMPVGKALVLFKLIAEPMTKDEARSAFIEIETKNKVKPDSARRSFSRALKSLLDDDFIFEKDELLQRHPD